MRSRNFYRAIKVLCTRSLPKKSREWHSRSTYSFSIKEPWMTTSDTVNTLEMTTWMRDRFPWVFVEREKRTFEISSYTFLSEWVFTVPFTVESSRLIWTTDFGSCSHFTSSSLLALSSWHWGLEIAVTNSLELISHLLPFSSSSVLACNSLLYQSTQKNLSVTQNHL